MLFFVLYMQQFFLQTIQRKRKHAQFPPKQITDRIERQVPWVLNTGWYSHKQLSLFYQDEIVYWAWHSYSCGIYNDVMCCHYDNPKYCYLKIDTLVNQNCRVRSWIVVLVGKLFENAKGIDKKRHSKIYVSFLCGISVYVDLVSLLLINPHGVYCYGHSLSFRHVISNSPDCDPKWICRTWHRISTDCSDS